MSCKYPDRVLEELDGCANAIGQLCYKCAQDCIHNPNWDEDMEKSVRCNWCGIITDKWCWQQKQKDGSIVAKCQRCVDSGKTIPLIPFNKKEKNEPTIVEYGG